MKYDQVESYSQSYRGRRFAACQAVDYLETIIKSIPDGPYSQLSEGIGKEAKVEGLPGCSPSQKDEILNLSAVLLRMILKANDGNVSPQKLRTF